MNKMNIEIRQTEIYKKWFENLKDKRARARIDIRIRRISFGNFGDVKPVGNGVSEIRIDYRPGYRVYFFQKRERVIILLCGGDKSSQGRDISKAYEIAQRRMEEL
jgi:putative addiction module killer protein